MISVLLLALDKFILFTRSVDIRRISLDTPSLVDVTLPVTGLQYTIGLDWSGERNAFYWCDYLVGTINVATLDVRLSTCVYKHIHTHTHTTRTHNKHTV